MAGNEVGLPRIAKPEAAEVQAWVDALRRSGYRVTDPPPPPPINRCGWCDKTDDDNERDGYGPLTDITVITSQSEEGYARELRHACQEHLETTTEALVELGFGSHRHGGINYLEDHRCPGYDVMNACPTPEDDD